MLPVVQKPHACPRTIDEQHMTRTPVPMGHGWVLLHWPAPVHWPPSPPELLAPPELLEALEPPVLPASLLPPLELGPPELPTPLEPPTPLELEPVELPTPLELALLVPEPLPVPLELPLEPVLEPPPLPLEPTPPELVLPLDVLPAPPEPPAPVRSSPASFPPGAMNALPPHANPRAAAIAAPHSRRPIEEVYADLGGRATGGPSGKPIPPVVGERQLRAPRAPPKIVLNRKNSEIPCVHCEASQVAGIFGRNRCDAELERRGDDKGVDRMRRAEASASQQGARPSGRFLGQIDDADSASVEQLIDGSIEGSATAHLGEDCRRHPHERALLVGDLQDRSRSFCERSPLARSGQGVDRLRVEDQRPRHAALASASDFLLT
jgi:hypothetical protein